jgi:CPA1 family monovalent cation:H+ antiporter
VNALSQFKLVATLLILTATFSWVNIRLALLPHTIGLLVMGLGASLVIIGAEAVVPWLANHEDLAGLVGQFNFQGPVLEGMLAFLLFAGALQVDVVGLRSRAVTIGAMATIGILVSTAIIGCGVWGVADLMGVPISFST